MNIRWREFMILLLFVCGFCFLAAALTSGFSVLLFMLGDVFPAQVFAWFAAGMGLLFAVFFLLFVFTYVGHELWFSQSAEKRDEKE